MQGISWTHFRPQNSSYLTTQMLCLPCKDLLLTLLSGIGVDGPSTRLAPGLPIALDGRGGAPPLPGVAAPLLAGPGDMRDVPLLLPMTDCRLALADLAALAARAAAASSTSAARTSSTSNCIHAKSVYVSQHKTQAGVDMSAHQHATAASCRKFMLML